MGQILLNTGGAPPTPAAGFTTIYVKADKRVYTKDDTGAELIVSNAIDIHVSSVAGKTGDVTLLKPDVGLANVDNTSDEAKPISLLQAAALALKANQTAVDLKADQGTTYTMVETDSRIQAVVGVAPGALDTLAELGAAFGNDADYAATVAAALSLKADHVGISPGLTAGVTYALKSATTTVEISSAVAPAPGQVLTATTDSAATWQTPGSDVGGLTALIGALIYG